MEKCREKLLLDVGRWPYRALTFPYLAAAAAFPCKRGETQWGRGNEGTRPPAHGLPPCPVSLQPGCSVLGAGEEQGHKAVLKKKWRVGWPQLPKCVHLSPDPGRNRMLCLSTANNVMAATTRLTAFFLCDLCLGFRFWASSSVGMYLQLESCNASGNKRQVGEGVRNENRWEIRWNQRVDPRWTDHKWFTKIWNKGLINPCQRKASLYCGKFWMHCIRL